MWSVPDIRFPDRSRETERFADKMSNLYRKLPKVDIYLEREECREWIAVYGRYQVADVIREALQELRMQMRNGIKEEDFSRTIQNLDAEVVRRLRQKKRQRMIPVINATGIILHTNLGRAPLPSEAAGRVAEILGGYSNLEYDLETGRRGERSSHFEDLLCSLTGAEAAVAVNNNAAAVLLMVSALCSGREVLISRGELVEIGGKFRIPEVVAQGGAVLREVGTTNKTHWEDYARAAGDNTAAVLKVHTSNFRIEGFTESVPTDRLKMLGFPVLEDLGSGCLYPLEHYGFRHEPTVREALERGADVVCFSGDKLLGGPQAGILAGKKKYIDIIRCHPLMRAVRPDKCTVAALELTLEMYARCREDEAVERIPVLRMLTEPAGTVRGRAERLLEMLTKRPPFCVEGPIPSLAEPGGGSLPGQQIPSFCVTVGADREERLMELEAYLRKGDHPVVVRIADHHLVIDLRTVREEETGTLAAALDGGMEVCGIKDPAAAAGMPG